MASEVILLTERRHAREVVVRRCAQAARFGVTLGMDLSQAQSFIPAYVRRHVQPHAPESAAAALQKLAVHLLHYAPLVALDPPDGLLLDVSGLERLYPGAAGPAHVIHRALDRWGVAARIGVATTFACAAAAARFAAQGVACVLPGQDLAALQDLPVEALRVDAQTTQALREVGLTRIEHLLALPRAALAAQFGVDLSRHLDQALGLLPEILTPLRPVLPPQAELLFDGPTTHRESVEAATREVLERLLNEAQSGRLALRRIELNVRRARGVFPAGRVQLSAPSRSRRHWWTMLRPLLERLDVEPGVEGVTLRGGDLVPLSPTQLALGDAGPAPNTRPALDPATEWAETIDTLVCRLGAANVLRFEPVESHLPEGAFRAVSVLRARVRTARAATTPRDRPTRLFDPPHVAAVVSHSPDGPILQIDYEGRRQRIIACRGPERIGCEWWRCAPAKDFGVPTERDYFAAQTEAGRWLWLVREVEIDCWRVHGDWS